VNYKELNEKIAKWAGFKSLTHQDIWPDINTNHPETIVKWKYPNGEIYYSIPKFYISLSQCDKWIMPKFLRVFLKTNHYGRYFTEVQFGDSDGFVIYSSESNNSLAESFCLAVEKLINNNKKKEEENV
jgi:hypothetical protein